MGSGASSRVKPGGLPPSNASNTMDPAKVMQIHSAIRWNNEMREIKRLIVSEAEANCRDNGDDGTSSDGIINAMYGGTLQKGGGSGVDDVAGRLGPGQIVRPATENRPAHIASQNGLLKVLKFLVKAGCDVNARNATGQTPMHMAVEYNYPKIVSFLLKMGADPEIKNNAGWSAIHGIDGVKNPESPDFQLNAILACSTTKQLMSALHAATAAGLDIGKVANFKITSSRDLPDMWDEECQDLLKELINKQRKASLTE